MTHAKVLLSNNTVASVGSIPPDLRGLSQESLDDVSAALSNVPAEHDGYGYWPVSDVIESLDDEEVTDFENPNHTVNTGPKTVTRTYPAVGMSEGRRTASRRAAKTARKNEIDEERDEYLKAGTTVSSRTYSKNEVVGVFQAYFRLNSMAPGGAKAITAITSANPGAFTVLAHGMETGTFCRVSSVIGMTELNDNIYSVVSTGAGSMTLKNIRSGADLDTSGFTTYVSGGTVTPVARIITGDNYTLYLTLAQAERLWKTVAAWQERIYDAGRRHKNAVEALTTTADILAYNSSSWPT